MGELGGGRDGVINISTRFITVFARDLAAYADDSDVLFMLSTHTSGLRVRVPSREAF